MTEHRPAEGPAARTAVADKRTAVRASPIPTSSAMPKRPRGNRRMLTSPSEIARTSQADRSAQAGNAGR